jgi:capsular polysaccharide biosynthesis protein
MSRSTARAAALAAAVSLSLAGSLAVASTASADEPVNPGSPAVAILYVAPAPVHPQPVIAGHEGDVLMQVNVAMPVKAVKQAKGKKRGR